jgi:hypothetical protein
MTKVKTRINKLLKEGQLFGHHIYYKFEKHIS